MSHSFRHSICNEVFEKTPFREACRKIREAGYTGIEIAPFTLAEKPTDIPAEQRREYRQILQDESLTFVGLHWLMVSPQGLHVTTPDDAIRQRSWDHIRELIDLAADLGPSAVMVFGSPKQRSTTGGITLQAAREIYTQELAKVAPHAESRGVTILVESLPSEQSDVINTLAEAVEIVRKIGNPAVQTMFDSHNATDETEPHAELVRKYASYIRHIHVNEMDGREPGTGNYDFRALLETLRDLRYEGWVSLEVFDFQAGAETIASGSLNYLKRVESSLL